jgi:hypothetical protein
LTNSVTRKLKEVGETLDSVISQEDIVQFLNDTENAEEFNILVEDIRNALLAYQVCTPELLAYIAFNSAPDLSTTGYL